MKLRFTHSSITGGLFIYLAPLIPLSFKRGGGVKKRGALPLSSTPLGQPTIKQTSGLFNGTVSLDNSLSLSLINNLQPTVYSADFRTVI